MEEVDNTDAFEDRRLAEESEPDEDHGSEHIINKTGAETEISGSLEVEEDGVVPDPSQDDNVEEGSGSEVEEDQSPEDESSDTSAAAADAGLSGTESGEDDQAECDIAVAAGAGSGEAESSEDVEDSEEDSNAAEEGEEEEDFELVGEDEFSLPLIQVVEALLFAADEPLSIEKIAKAAGKRIRREIVLQAVNELAELYRETERAFEIVEVAEKFQMLTRAEFAGNVQALYGKRAVKEEKDKKLSPAVLDTLAIIAYKQPVTRAEVEAVRGVGCSQVMRQLMERGSIKPVGKKMDVIGYPLLYGTTEFFLQEFGLASLDVLPMAAELRRLTQVQLPKAEVVEGEGNSVEEVHSKLDGAVVVDPDTEDNLVAESSVEEPAGMDEGDDEAREDS